MFHYNNHTREARAKINVLVALVSQIVTLICGLIIPGLLIRFFGSETYGATTSIAQFLAYITLLEGGVGGVARAALYKPLSEKNYEAISSIINEIKFFFKIVAYIFAIYVLVLAFVYHDMSNITGLDRMSTFVLVIVISLSTFAQYFVGISYSVLLQADQKAYITNLINVLTIILNTILIIVFVFINSNIIIVKLVSGCVFTVRPLLMWLYVKRNYKLVPSVKRNKDALSQKWTALGQHIAFFLHSNTDIAVLTILSNLSSVAVYSVYNMIISSMQNVTASFTAGMEAAFGDMIAKGENDVLQRTFSYYETLISGVSILLYGVSATLIVPFVALYTKGIEDVNYIVPQFAMTILLASILYCLRLPYHAVVIASSSFKETRIAGYGEAIINIFLSVILVQKIGLVGVALGTLVATSFRFLFYVFYLSRKILNRRIGLFIKRVMINVFIFVLINLLGRVVVKFSELDSIMNWLLSGCIITVLSVVVILIVLFIFYTDDVKSIIAKITKKHDR